jgi:hypothetical protein
MSESAQVRSIEVIANFQATLAKFGEDASAALFAMQQELARVVDWLEQDRPRFWKRQIHRCYDEIAEARSALETCRMKKVAGRTPTCIDEQVALQKAKKKLEYCEQKVQLVRRWADKVRHESGEFTGKTGNLQHFIEGEVPRMKALLERTVDILEAYAEVSHEPRDTSAGTGTADKGGAA